MGQLGWHKPSPSTIIMIDDHDEDPNWKKTANISYLEDAGMVLHRIVSGMILINVIEGCQVVSRGGVQRPRLGWPAGFINYGGQSTINHHLCRVCGIPAPFLLEWGYYSLGLHLINIILLQAMILSRPWFCCPWKLAGGWEWGDLVVRPLITSCALHCPTFSTPANLLITWPLLSELSIRNIWQNGAISLTITIIIVKGATDKIRCSMRSATDHVWLPCPIADDKKSARSTPIDIQLPAASTTSYLGPIKTNNQANIITWNAVRSRPRQSNWGHSHNREIQI